MRVVVRAVLAGMVVVGSVLGGVGPGSGTAAVAAGNPSVTEFRDVATADYFYGPVQYLTWRGVVAGYDCGDGCKEFRPYSFTTRAQLAKILALARDFPLVTPGTSTFADLPASDPFFSYVETAVARGVVAGYACGQGCREFRPYGDVTRAQLVKMVVKAYDWPLISGGAAHFADVPPGDPFFEYVETAVDRGTVAGYGDGSFRPGNSATRGQIGKIVYQAETAGMWRPAVRTRWQWQLSQAPIDQSVAADMYDIDLFDIPASTVASLHAAGRKVVCYISAGSLEDWRPDRDSFPPQVIGNDYEGWPGEKWLDIRRIDLLGPIMAARLDLCRAKGFDGVEPDNIQGYEEDTGFPLTYADQINYNAWLAHEAHKRGLSIGLKNDPGQAHDMLPLFDWALSEHCFRFDWCDQVAPFVAAGKPVFQAEYAEDGTTTAQLCPTAAALQFNAIIKQRELGVWRQACP